MKVKLPWPFEPPLICVLRVYEAHANMQDAKPKLLRGQFNRSRLKSHTVIILGDI